MSILVGYLYAKMHADRRGLTLCCGSSPCGTFARLQSDVFRPDVDVSILAISNGGSQTSS